MIGLFCKGPMGKAKSLEDFTVEEFSSPADCLGRTLLAVLQADMDSGLTEEMFNRLTCRMQARTQAAPWLMPNGTWLIATGASGKPSSAVKEEDPTETEADLKRRRRLNTGEES